MVDPLAIEVQATLENLKRVREFVRNAAATFGLTPSAVADVELAVDEAVTNVVLHGYESQGGTVRVQAASEDDALALRIVDEAAPFDPRQAAAPDLNLPLEERPIGGVGVLLIEKSVDEVRYRRTAGGENELTLIKKRRGTAVDAGDAASGASPG